MAYDRRTDYDLVLVVFMAVFTNSPISDPIGRGCRLEVIGSEIGGRLLELLSFREKTPRRKCHIVDILKFVHSTVWPYMFGKTADSLEQAKAVSCLLCEIIQIYIFDHTS